MYVFILFILICNYSKCTLGLHGPAVYQLTKPFDHGECPTWDPRSRLLYFVNIFEGGLLSYNPIKNTVNSVKLPGTVAPVIPAKASRNRFIVGVNRTIFSIEWDGTGDLGATQVLTEVSNQYPTSRLNDGKADKQGRLWIGTMGFEGPNGVTPDEGVLYFIDKNTLHNPATVIHPVNISNGMAWNKANNRFYYIDTLTFTVVEYEYNNSLGKISNPRVAFDVRKHSEIGGYPDGMTIDKDDNLWIALYWGGAIIKVNPKTGALLQVVAIPAQCVSSVAWGGINLDTMFVTTSRHALSSEERLKQPAAGSLFAITNLGTHGLPAFYADL